MLNRDYAGQECALARALEVVGERWTMLIVRDAFYGVARFNDFLAHLDISRAVLATRLRRLVDQGVLRRVPGPGQSGAWSYELTEAGAALWPVLYTLRTWADTFVASDSGPVRVFRHVTCGTELDGDGGCPACGTSVDFRDVLTEPGPGDPSSRQDRVSVALREQRRLGTPLGLS